MMMTMTVFIFLFIFFSPPHQYVDENTAKITVFLI